MQLSYIIKCHWGDIIIMFQRLKNLREDRDLNHLLFIIFCFNTKVKYNHRGVNYERF